MIFPFKCPFRVRKKKCQAPCLIAEGTHIDIDDPQPGPGNPCCKPLGDSFRYRWLRNWSSLSPCANIFTATLGELSLPKDRKKKSMNSAACVRCQKKTAIAMGCPNIGWLTSTGKWTTSMPVAFVPSCHALEVRKNKNMLSHASG